MQPIGFLRFLRTKEAKLRDEMEYRKAGYDLRKQVGHHKPVVGRIMLQTFKRRMQFLVGASLAENICIRNQDTVDNTKVLIETYDARR